MEMFYIYWETPKSGSQDDYTIALYNNLFGFPYFTPEKLSEIQLERTQLQSHYSSIKILMNPDIISYITSLKNHCNDINLDISLIKDPAHSKHFIVNSSGSLTPYQNLQNVYINLNPAQANPAVQFRSDFLLELTQSPAETLIFEFNFTRFADPPRSRLFNWLSFCSFPQSIISLKIRQPNGKFINYISKSEDPLVYLKNHICSITGYQDLQIFQRPDKHSKKVLKNLSAPMSTIITSSSNRILFTEIKRNC